MKTWHIEALVIAAILAATVLLTGNDPKEWLGSAAVFVMTRRVSVGDRMQEAEQAAASRGETPQTECYRWFHRYLYIAEALWCAYFIAHGAWSALVGVGMMLLYPVWRRVYRRWRPRDRHAA